MHTPSREQLLNGRKALPSPTRTLYAGPLSVSYDGGDLRYVRLGQQEILRRVYAAVRDHNWATVIPEISNEVINAHEDRFRITYDATYQMNEIDFAAKLTIDGTADGTITFSFAGEARSTFRRNRIGFCVLHPMDLAGHNLTIEHVDGTRAEDTFPRDIMPHQPYFGLRTIEHEVATGVRASVRMEGDTFEMEDQRNWTDASYKTYCTPLAEPFPVEVAAGTRVEQSIRISVVGAGKVERVSATLPELTTTDQRALLPQLGLGIASHGEPLSPVEIDRLRALHLDHLRVDLHFGQTDVAVALRQATVQARALGVALHVALHLTDTAEAELAEVQRLVHETDAPVSAWLIFRVGEPSTGAQWVRLARERLADTRPHARFIGGTDAFFTQLNRGRPDIDALDAVVYSINPQVHAFENVDLVETLPAQGATVQTARTFSGDLPIFVSPVTLKMRHNPDATGPAPDVPAGTLPPQVDPRQMSLFGAVWTLGSLKALAESGAASVTYYETAGWRGVMERADGSPLPALFPSLPGSVFPLYHVLADVSEFSGADVRVSSASASLTVDGLLLQDGNRQRWLVANYTATDQTVRLANITTAAQVRVLDENTVMLAMTDPEAFRALYERVAAAPDGLTLTLRPYAVATVDVELAL